MDLLVTSLKSAPLFTSIHCQDALHPGSLSFSFVITCPVEFCVSVGENNLLLSSSYIIGNVIIFGFSNIVSINVSVVFLEENCSCLVCLGFALFRLAYKEFKLPVLSQWVKYGKQL